MLIFLLYFDMLNAEKVNKTPHIFHGEYGSEVSTLDRKSKDYEGRWVIMQNNDECLSTRKLVVYHLLLYVENWIDFF